MDEPKNYESDSKMIQYVQNLSCLAYIWGPIPVLNVSLDAILHLCLPGTSLLILFGFHHEVLSYY